MRRLVSCRIAGVLLAALMLVPLPIGCAKKKRAASTPEEPTGNPLKPEPGGRTSQTFIGRGVQRQVNQQLMVSLGRYHLIFNTEKGRDPRDLQEFIDYLKSDPDARTAKLPQALEGGWIVMQLTPGNTGNRVLAYEKEMFQAHQNRLVLLKGGAVKMMTEPEFQAALKGE